MKKNYETVSQAINDLITRGYTIDFKVHAEKDCLYCDKTSVALSPEEFHIDETHRFEGNTDPGDEMIVFAISSHDGKHKGVVMDAYGMYADAETSKIVSRLKKG